MAIVYAMGHGDFEPGTNAGMVAVPPGTTVHFHTDAGQRMRYDESTAYQLIAGDLEKPEPVVAGGVVYNYMLSPFGADEAYGQSMPDLRNYAVLNDVEIQTADGGPMWLCTGDERTCPPVAFEPGEGRSRPLGGTGHGCAGVLGRHQGKEIHWIACQAFEFDDGGSADAEALVAARDYSPPSIFLGEDRHDWNTAIMGTAAKPSHGIHDPRDGVATPVQQNFYLDFLQYCLLRIRRDPSDTEWPRLAEAAEQRLAAIKLAVLGPAAQDEEISGDDEGAATLPPPPDMELPPPPDMELPPPPDMELPPPPDMELPPPPGTETTGTVTQTDRS